MTTVSTSAFYDRAGLDISSLRKRAEDLQASISSGQRLTRSSDDPVAASRLRQLSRTDSFSAVDKTAANRANADLTLTDSALSSFADYITRIKELATQAASGTLTAAQRSGIGTEIAELQKDLVSLANTRDSVGNALFGGTATGQAYTVDGSGNATYAGSASAAQLELGDGQTVTNGVTGPEFLNFSVNGTPTNLFAVVKGLADALQGGSSDPAGAANQALDSLDTGLDSVTTAQTVVGARMNWVELTTDRRTQMAELRSQEESDVGGTDIASAVSKLQETMTVLEASQASFAKLSGLSLFSLLN